MKCTLFLALIASASAHPFFFVPLSIKTNYKNGDPHLVAAEEQSVGVDSWSFAASRSDPEKRTVEEGNGVGVGSGIYNGVLSWIMPQSRSDRDHMDSDGGQSNEVKEAFLGLPNGISANLAERQRLQEANNPLPKDKIAELQDKLASDVSNAIKQASTKNEIKSQLETPGFFDSFSMVSHFLNQMANSLFLMPIDQRYTRSYGSDDVIGVDDRLASATVKRERRQADDDGVNNGIFPAGQEVELPSFGEAGEIINDVISSVLNAVTVYKLQHLGKDCAARHICEWNRKIFSRGYTVPQVVTYALNLVLSAYLVDDGNGKMFDLLWAARLGRKGNTDCLEMYPSCKVKL